MRNLNELLDRFRAQYDDMMGTAQEIRRIIEVECGGPAHAHSKRLSMILWVVSHHYQMPQEVFASKIRTKEYALCRQVAMFLCRELTRFSLNDIAAAFRPGMDHNTITYGVASIAERVATDPKFRDELQRIREKAVKGINSIDQRMSALRFSVDETRTGTQ